MTTVKSPHPAQPADPIKTNALSIASLVLAFVVPIAGVITGHIALRQIKRSGEAGRPYAVWGTAAGYVFVTVQLMFLGGLVGLGILLRHVHWR